MSQICAEYLQQYFQVKFPATTPNQCQALVEILKGLQMTGACVSQHIVTATRERAQSNDIL